MHYIHLRFTYLLTYLLTCTNLSKGMLYERVQ